MQSISEKPLPSQNQLISTSLKPTKLAFEENEINLFDIIFTLQRNWKTLVSCLMLALTISTLIAYRMYITRKHSIPVILPPETIVSAFVLPRIALSDDGTRFVPAMALAEKEELLKKLQFHIKKAFAASTESVELSFEALAKKSESSRDHALNIILISKDSGQKQLTENTSKILDLSLEKFTAELHADIRSKIDSRIENVEQLKEQLRELLLRNTSNRIFVRERELEIKRQSLSDRIKALENESFLRRGNELKVLEEQRNVQRNEIERELLALRQLATVRRQDRIETLKEALAIAEKIGIENVDERIGQIGKSAVEQRIDSKYGSTETDSMLYLRGKKALLAEINQLEVQSNDGIMIPEIRELEQGLKLIKDDSRYFALKARKDDRFFSNEIPGLVTQLKLIDNDEELSSLKKMLSNPQTIELYSKDSQNLNSDLMHTRRVGAEALKMKFITYDEPSNISSNSRAFMVIAVGTMLGLMLSSILILFFEGWKAHYRNRQAMD